MVGVMLVLSAPSRNRPGDDSNGGVAILRRERTGKVPDSGGAIQEEGLDEAGEFLGAAAAKRSPVGVEFVTRHLAASASPRLQFGQILSQPVTESRKDACSHC